MEDGARGGRQSHQPMLHWLMQGPSDRGVSWRQGQDSLTPNQGDGVKNTEGWGGVRKSLPQGPICCCGTGFQTWIHYRPDASCRQLCKLPSLSSVRGTKDTRPPALSDVYRVESVHVHQTRYCSTLSPSSLHPTALSKWGMFRMPVTLNQIHHAFGIFLSYSCSEGACLHVYLVP